MNKHLILYFSKTGNSRFMAHKLAALLDCDAKEIIPTCDGTGILYLLSLLRVSVPTNCSSKELLRAEEIVILGPVWGGLLISPLRRRALGPPSRRSPAPDRRRSAASTCSRFDPSPSPRRRPDRQREAAGHGHL